MTTRMLINATAPRELRIAIVEDGELIELDIEANERSSIRGNIYKGVVHNVEGSLAAAFVDIGVHKHAFLPFDEISPAQYAKPWTSESEPSITDVIKRGQEILVQVAKDAVGEKGAFLTTYLSLPGRYTVLMPDREAGGISRKIDDEAVRRRLRVMATKLTKPDGCGFIVRTAGFAEPRTSIQRDLDALGETWSKAKAAFEIARAPSILYAEPDLIARTLRDYFSDEIDEVLIDHREEYEAARAYFEQVMPDYADRLSHFDNPIPIFAYHRVEEQIEATFERRVELPSGGSIVIDQTEALVAIDVNSGRMTSERGHEETVFKTNCEAAEAVAQQLRLRDLGGIIVVDFIDMERTENKREVERVLSEATSEDKARYKFARINAKGLLVLTRQRIRQGMRKAFQRRCEVCGGTGWRRTAESHAISLLRRIETRLAQGGVGEVRVVTHPETAAFVLNERRSRLSGLEEKYRCHIVITARADIDKAQDDVRFVSHGELLAEITDKLPPREERKKQRVRKKRTRKRKAASASDGAAKNGKAASDGEERSEEAAAGNGAEKKKSSRRRRKPKSSSAGQPAAAAASGDGPTFTGRPPPELLEKMKAERKAKTTRAPKPAAPPAPVEAKRGGLLGRLFGPR